MLADCIAEECGSCALDRAAATAARRCRCCDSNGITDVGAKLLARAIADSSSSSSSSSIMTLQLANNKIGEAGAVALLKAVQQSGSITTLDLRGNAAAMRARTVRPRNKQQTQRSFCAVS